MLNYTFDWNIVFESPYRDWILSGLRTTIWISILSCLGSFGLGLIVAILRSSNMRALRVLTGFYLEFIRNTPLLVQIFFWYFGSYKLLPTAWNDWLNATNQFEIIASIVALTIYTSAFIAEDIRSGVLSVPKEQMEAARSAGFSYFASMRYVVLPQAIRLTVAPIVNQFLNLTKNSSLAMTIGVAELTYQARQIESRTLKSFEAFAVSTLLYLLISIVITVLIDLYNERVLRSSGGAWTFR